MHSTDVCILGGGIAGLTCARALARGGMRVTLVERNGIGGGTSSVAAGMLAPLVEARLEEESVVRFGIEALRYYPEFVAALEEETGHPVDYRTEGTLVVAHDRDEAEQLRHLYQEQTALGLPVEWLTGYECRQIEPYLAPGIPAGIFSRDDHQVDNRLLLGALAASCRERHGVTIIEEAGNGKIERSVGDRYIYTVNGETIEADHVVIATGARGDLLGSLLPDLAHVLRPVKGALLRLDQSRMPILSHIVRSPRMYLVPKSSGQLVLGASSEEKGFDESLIAGEMFELLRRAWECVPAIWELPILEACVGFRPATIDHAPLLGESSIPGLWIATGYYRHGILFAPYAAELLAAAICSREPNDWLLTFSPRRFDETDTERTDD